MKAVLPLLPLNEKRHEDLRYCLRSVSENLQQVDSLAVLVNTNSKLPSWLKPDEIVRTPRQLHPAQDVNVKLANFYKDFDEQSIILNDDFFIMEPVTTLKEYYYERDFQDIIESRKGRLTGYYSEALENTDKKLRELRLNRRNYELHVPMPIYYPKAAKAALEAVAEENNMILFRSIYGNSVSPKHTRMLKRDYKVRDKKILREWNEPFLSSHDDSFEYMTQYLEKKFPNKSQWEI